MTVVAKAVLTRPVQDAKIYPSSGQWMWGNQANDTIAFVPNEYLVFRYYLDIPKGATITSATWRFEYSQKDAAPAQTATLIAYFEDADNSAPWPYTDGTLMPGPTTSFPRPRLTGTTITVNYPGGSTPGTDSVTTTLTTQIQALVNRAGWEAGNYVTLAVLVVSEGSGSDLSIQMSEAWWATYVPQFDIAYTHDDDTAARSDVNLALNQVMTDTRDVGTQEMSGNAQGGVTFSTRSTGGRDGGPCLEMVAHPPAGQETRMAIVYEGFAVAPGTYAFSGWFYNPKSNPANFVCQFTFLGGSVEYPQRDQWTPFSTTPLTIGAAQVLWCSMGFAAGPAKTEGNSMLLDDVCVQQTNVQEMPFNAEPSPLINGNFEQWNVFDPWLGTPPTLVGWTGGIWSKGRPLDTSGTVTGRWNGGTPSLSNQFPVLAGQTVSYSGRMKNEAGSTDQPLTALVFNGNTAALYGTWTGATTSPVQSPSGSAVAPVGATYAQVYIWPQVTSLWDDFAVTTPVGLGWSKWNADHVAKETVSHGVSVRRNYRRTHVLENSVSRPRRNYVRNQHGLWVRADQQRMITWDHYAGTTWDTMPAGMTWNTVG